MRPKIKRVATEWGRHSPSVARALSSSEQVDLIAIARGLPAEWCVTIDPPHGQVAISPLDTRVRNTRCWIASTALGRITREPWRPAR